MKERGKNATLFWRDHWSRTSAFYIARKRTCFGARHFTGRIDGKD